MLMYLRDPGRYAIWLKLTHAGLAALTGFAEPVGRTGGWDRYLRYSEAALAFARQYGLEPQEVDAVLSEAGRAAEAERGVRRPPTTLARHEGETTTADQPPEPDIGATARRMHLPVDLIEEWAGLLRDNPSKRQALLYGPPGTGKTWVASELALFLAGSPDRVRLAQFHPSFAYEDFIEGLRPKVEGSGLTYEVRPGLFTEFCSEAAGRPGTFVFIIDELNRADVGSVLGELMLLLEYRERTVRLPYSQRVFSVPENVIVLATMNTADRSLALVDFALRRRFHAIALYPSRDVLASYLAERPEGPALEMFDLVQQRVGDPSVAPGHSYWMRDDLGVAALERLWRYELRPYLAEHWFENRSELDRLDGDVARLLAEET
jgi:hypothetical protein